MITHYKEKTMTDKPTDLTDKDREAVAAFERGELGIATSENTHHAKPSALRAVLRERTAEIERLQSIADQRHEAATEWHQTAIDIANEIERLKAREDNAKEWIRPAVELAGELDEAVALLERAHPLTADWGTDEYLAMEINAFLSRVDAPQTDEDDHWTPKPENNVGAIEEPDNEWMNAPMGADPIEPLSPEILQMMKDEDITKERTGEADDDTLPEETLSDNRGGAQTEKVSAKKPAVDVTEGAGELQGDSCGDKPPPTESSPASAPDLALPWRVEEAKENCAICDPTEEDYEGCYHSYVNVVDANGDLWIGPTDRWKGLRIVEAVNGWYAQSAEIEGSFITRDATLVKALRQRVKELKEQLNAPASDQTVMVYEIIDRCEGEVYFAFENTIEDRSKWIKKKKDPSPSPNFHGPEPPYDSGGPPVDQPRQQVEDVSKEAGLQRQRVDELEQDHYSKHYKQRISELEAERDCKQATIEMYEQCRDKKSLKVKRFRTALGEIDEAMGEHPVIKPILATALNEDNDNDGREGTQDRKTDGRCAPIQDPVDLQRRESEVDQGEHVVPEEGQVPAPLTLFRLDVAYNQLLSEEGELMRQLHNRNAAAIEAEIARIWAALR